MVNSPKAADFIICTDAVAKQMHDDKHVSWQKFIAMIPGNLHLNDTI